MVSNTDAGRMFQHPLQVPFVKAEGLWNNRLYQTRDYGDDVSYRRLCYDKHSFYLHPVAIPYCAEGDCMSHLAFDVLICIIV